MNGTDLDDLLMQSTNIHSNATGFSINNNDIMNRYGKWDNLERNKVAITKYTVANKDINEYFNKRKPTFQATLSGTFTYTGSIIQPNILVSPASTTEYTIKYNGQKDAKSYSAVESDFILPDGYVWDSGYPAGSFTIEADTLTGTVNNIYVEWDGKEHTASITGINGTYTIEPDTLTTPSISRTDIGSSSATITGYGNYTGTITCRIEIIKPSTIIENPYLSAAVNDNSMPANVIPYFTGKAQIYINDSVVVENAISGKTYNLNTMSDDPLYIGDINQSEETITLKVTNLYGEIIQYILVLNCTQISGTTYCSFIER